MTEKNFNEAQYKQHYNNRKKNVAKRKFFKGN